MQKTSRTHLIIIGTFTLLLGVISSCGVVKKTSKKNSKESTTPAVAIAFTSPARTIFDNKCAKCHAVGGDAAMSWTYDPNDFQSTVYPHRELLKSLTSTTGRMAGKDYANLSAEEINSLQAWFAAGAPAK